MFLVLLRVYPGESLPPTRAIDMVWHTYIEDGAPYREDMIGFLGRPLDHYPYFGIQDAGAKVKLMDSFGSTRRLFQLHFGVDPTDLAQRYIAASHARNHAFYTAVGPDTSAVVGPAACSGDGCCSSCAKTAGLTSDEQEIKLGKRPRLVLPII